MKIQESEPTTESVFETVKIEIDNLINGIFLNIWKVGARIRSKIPM